MEENKQYPPVRRPNPRRRPPAKRKLNPRFLVTVGVVVALFIMFIIFAVGSVQRADEKREQERQESLAADASIAQQQLEWEQEAQRLITESEFYAASCDFDKAIEVLDMFSGDPDDFPDLVACREKYENGDAQLVVWEDVTQIPMLSFSDIIDPETGFSGGRASYNRYYCVSATEFTAILEDLYENGFMLVDMDDIFTTTQGNEGQTIISKKELRLPQGKKPIILVHCQPEGFANKLTVDAAGKFVSQAEDGGAAYDFVPLLEEFIAKNPGFTFRGSRAILALTGYNGLFGYDVTEADSIVKVAQALKDTGYTLAGNTFGNARYGKLEGEELDADIAQWETDVEALIGETDILVFAQSNDIDDGKEPYADSTKKVREKYEKLQEAGFRFYLGVSYNGSTWMSFSKESVRIGRVMILGNNMKEKASMYASYFDAAAIYEEYDIETD